MTTFEIITLAEDLNKVNNRDAQEIKTWIYEGQYMLEAIANEDGYWSVYLTDCDTKDIQYVSTHSVFSMSGAIAEAIDNVIKAVNEWA